ncbi:MAG: hypothetical protein BWY15_00420 [Firmicutes bacterium ADurb.Bin193]|nr:MAG: hypothetical protein BWY15_00420 [Firmicutes bacterium ADurb.Bin193]
MELIHVIQKVVSDVINSIAFTDVCYGEVIQIDPLKVKISNKLIIGNELILLTSNVTEQKHTHNVTGDSEISEAITAQPLEVGDKILMLKAQRGGLYVVLDRLVN